MGRSGQEAIVEVAFLFPGQGSQEPGMLHDLTPGQGTEAVLREMSGTLGFDVLHSIPLELSSRRSESNCRCWLQELLRHATCSAAAFVPLW